MKLKLSDGLATIAAIVTQAQVDQQGKQFKKETRQWSVIEIKRYTKKVINGTSTVLMVNEFRVVYDGVRVPIGEPKTYAEREAMFTSEEGEEEMSKVDVTIPYKLAPILPMDHDEEGNQEALNDSKLNSRDKRLLEVDNPEEDVKNPFASSFADPYLQT